MVEAGNPRCYKIIRKCNDIIILQPMKQKTNKPGELGIKQKSLRQIVLEGFAKQEEFNKRQDERWERQEEFNKQVINRLDRHDQLFEIVLNQFKSHKWIK